MTDLLIWFIARDYFVMMNILGFGEPLWSYGSFVLYGVMEVVFGDAGFYCDGGCLVMQDSIVMEVVW